MPPAAPRTLPGLVQARDQGPRPDRAWGPGVGDQADRVEAGSSIDRIPEAGVQGLLLPCGSHLSGHHDVCAADHAMLQRRTLLQLGAWVYWAQ